MTTLLIQTENAPLTDSGALLGWLIDRQQRRVYVYRPNQEPQTVEDPEAVSSEP